MKKLVLTALLAIFSAALFAAEAAPAPAVIDIDELKKDGYTVEYNWETITAVVRGRSGSVNVVLNYPYVVSSTGAMSRIDAAPYSDAGRMFITEQAAREIKRLAAGGAGVAPTPTMESYVIRQTAAPTAVPTQKPVPVNEAAKPTETPEPAQEQEPVIVENGNNNSVKSSDRKLIILDPGHGGQDPGAIGANDLQEKDVVLYVAKKLKQELAGLPVDVIISRDTDKFITLKNRAVLANSKKADLFVSIHCNSSTNRNASGVRTYIYSRVASSKEAAAAAKYENKEVGAFEFLLNDLRKSAYEYLSIEAAGNIQHNVTKELKLKWEPTERAPFYVLANTNMPSVLVEIAFISNKKEEAKMKENSFRDSVAEGIAAGIKQYLEKIK